MQQATHLWSAQKCSRFIGSLSSSPMLLLVNLRIDCLMTNIGRMGKGRLAIRKYVSENGQFS